MKNLWRAPTVQGVSQSTLSCPTEFLFQTLDRTTGDSQNFVDADIVFSDVDLVDADL